MLSDLYVRDGPLGHHYIVRRARVSESSNCSAGLGHFAVDLLARLANHTNAIVFFVNKELSCA